MARKKRSDSKKSSPSKKQSRPELILNDKLNELTADELKQFLEFAGSLPRIATETLSSPDMLARHLQARQILGLVDPEENPKLAYEAAKKALQVCDECMEAHMRLGELESNPAKVAEHYRAAAEAGKWMVHAIDTDDISENPILAAYLGFRIQMSDHLWSFGQRVESIEHLMESYLLDEENYFDCGLRLLFRLVDLGWDEELEECLLAGANAGSLAGQALLDSLIRYRMGEDREKGAESLKIAAEANPLLIEYLLGETHLPGPHDEEDASDEDMEAIATAQIALPIVRGIPGYVRWMRETLGVRKKEESDWKRSRAEERLLLADLPQEEEAWWVECRRVGEMWLFVVYCPESEESIRIESLEFRPTTAVIWEMVSETMRDPKGQPRRPTSLIVTKGSLEKAWKRRCEALEIDCRLEKEPSIPSKIFDEFSQIVSRVDVDVELTSDIYDQLRELPQWERTWVVGAFQPPLWITDSATPRRPCVILVVDQETGLVLMQDMSDRFEEETLLKTVMKAMLSSLLEACPGHRPERILLHPKTRMSSLEEPLQELEIELDLADEESVTAIEECVESLIRHMSGPEGRQALLDAEGVTENEMASLFQAVARFWKMAPWRLVPGDRPIEIRSSAFPDQVWYAVIVGQLGMNLGVVLYDQKEAMDSVMTSDGSFAEPDGVFLNYLEKFEIPSIDLWYQEKFEWVIASEEAYPLIERALPKMKHRRPNRSELMALDVVLRTLPAFVNSPETEESFTLAVQAFDRRAEVVARWLS